MTCSLVAIIPLESNAPLIIDMPELAVSYQNTKKVIQMTITSMLFNGLASATMPALRVVHT